MKKLAKKLTFLALIVASVMILLPTSAHASGKKSLRLNIKLISQQVVHPGDVLVMDLEMPAQGQSDLVVTNRQGKVVWSTQLSLAAGPNKIKFNIGTLSDGVYFLKVRSGEKSATQTFAVQ